MSHIRTLGITTSLLLVVTLQTRAQVPADQPFQGIIGKSLKDSKEWWAPVPKPPAGAPNVVWILLDDVGFGASSAFGGLIHTPYTGQPGQ